MLLPLSRHCVQGLCVQRPNLDFVPLLPTWARLWSPRAEDHLGRCGLGGLPGHQELWGQGGWPVLHTGLRQYHLPRQSGMGK
jgi:hypothetical protein